MTDREWLIELHTKAHNEWLEKEYDRETDKSLAEYTADYLLENSVIAPPCKVGQTVYYVFCGKVYKGECHAITQHKDSLQIHLYDYEGDNASVSAKNVFLTKTEAEEKLKERDR